jgi:phosphoribosylformimino-5-aminoimidazole carboxamide ribotide isomerase
VIIYPAIDLRGGKVVRLKEGDPARQTVFSDDPIATAERWHSEGAQWLHVVNLDGALEAATSPLSTARAMAERGLHIQMGGGIRTRAAVAAALDAGVSRVVLGTAAIENPVLVEECVAAFGPDAVCIALDARDGRITTRGWTELSDQTPADFGKRLAEMGVRHALYTDVARDGLLTGSAVEATIALARETGLSVIASGGVQSIAEIEQLTASGAVGGAVIGMALYTGLLTLPDALAAARGA